MNYEEFKQEVADRIKEFLPEKYADADVSIQTVVRYLMLGTDICDCSQDIIHRSAVLMLLIKLVKVNVGGDIAVLKLYHKTIQLLIIVLYNCLNGNIRICVLLRQKLLDTVCHFLLKFFVIHAFAPPFIATSFCI